MKIRVLSIQVRRIVYGLIILLFCKAYRYHLTRILTLFQTNSSSITAIELDKEADGSQLRESIGTKTPAIWIRGQFIGDYNALNKLNTNGELDTLIKFIPKTTHKSPR